MKRLIRILIWSALWLGSFAITFSSLVYFDRNELAAFVIEKLPLPAEDFYLWTLRIHVSAAALALPGCLILSTKYILKRWPRFHRWCGRFTGYLVMLALVPSGAYLALFAKGGWASSFGFWLSGAIVLVAMVQAIRTARARQYAKHRRMTFHVLGQLSVAVSSRTMLYLFDFSTVDPELAYLISLWVPVVGTFALVEFLVSPNLVKTSFRRLYEKVVASFGLLRSRRAGVL